MHLIIDTETTGLPKSYSAPVADVDNWTRIVQIAWILCDDQGELREQSMHLLKPDGFEVSQGACRVHGISTEHARENGEDLNRVLDRFVESAQAADVIVAHNIDFDLSIVGAEFVRAGIDFDLARKQLRCTMRECSRFFGKWPKLGELHDALFGSAVDNAHDALSDALACMKCFFELRRRGSIG